MPPRKPALQITSTPTLQLGGGTLAGQRWMDLLASVGETHSITAAAKAVGLSYKAAWDAVEAMNNLADKPLVARSKGGRGGGGTTLTPRGAQLVQTWRAVADENRRFLQLMNTRMQNASADLQVLGRLTMLTSARNHFSGQVVAISAGVVNDEVVLALSGGAQITAVVTHSSVENLGLKLGSEAVALVKASWVMVAVESPGRQLKLSARNQLRGTVQRLTPGAVNTEVVIALKGGNSVAAIITNTSANDLQLVEGLPAIAIFKASSVILGVMV
ncbi:MAG: TOBE domain-containing protein [Pseudomonadota bacterium]